jgi:gamma-glutamylcyclotransferase (GGCT)/AIG2-like uncharacterized protein YtfP
MRELLFAYGTLQPGCAPAGVATLAAKLRPVGEGFVCGVLYDLGRYPGAVPDAHAKSRIAGTVMVLPEDENFLGLLDEYEGFDPLAADSSEFVRERQRVELSDGRRLECWFYRYNGKLAEPRTIASGAWRRSSSQ